MRPAPPDISAVVPFFDEEASAFAVVVETAEALAALGGTWEAILVNDGSSDRTGSELERAARERPQCRIITLPRKAVPVLVGQAVRKPQLGKKAKSSSRDKASSMALIISQASLKLRPERIT